MDDGFRKSRLSRNFLHDSSFALITTRLKLAFVFLSSMRFSIHITRLYFLRLVNFSFACSQLIFQRFRPFMFVGANTFWHCTVCNLKNFTLENAFTVTTTYTMAYNFLYVSLSALHSIFILSCFIQVIFWWWTYGDRCWATSIKIQFWSLKKDVTSKTDIFALLAMFGLQNWRLIVTSEEVTLIVKINVILWELCLVFNPSGVNKQHIIFRSRYSTLVAASFIIGQ